MGLRDLAKMVVVQIREGSHEGRPNPALLNVRLVRFGFISFKPYSLTS